MLALRKMDVQQRVDLASEAWKAAPPVAVVGADLIMGHGISFWVGWATIAYIALQAGYLIWKWRRESRPKRGR